MAPSPGEKAARHDRRIFLLGAAGILIFQLMTPPVVGWADNGDFPKVTGRYGLYVPGAQGGPYDYATTTYEFRPRDRWVSGFSSSEVPLLWSAIRLNNLISKDGNFDIRVM